MDELPYKAEYAKSNRASCKKCKQKIDKDILRIAAMIQSFRHDGRDAHWFHFDCFFAKHRPKSVEDIENLESLRYEDQESIRDRIKEFSGILLPEPGAKKGKKRAADNDSNEMLKDFGIEYSVSSRAECVGCHNKIMQEDLRVKKMVYDTEVGARFGGQPLWHHLSCFAAIRGDYGFYLGGRDLPGFSALSKEDKKKVEKEIKAIKIDAKQAKKLKAEPKDEVDMVAENALEATMKKQSNQLYKIRDQLKVSCTKADLQNILFANNSCMVVGENNLLDRCADLLTFGAIEKCPKCSKGDFIFSKHGYKCNGMLDSWVDCGNYVEKPKRKKCKIPSELKQTDFFKNYHSKVEDRAVRPEPLNVKKEKAETEVREAKVQREREPLYNMHVVIIGSLTAPKDELKHQIQRLGGKLVTKLQDKIAFVISTPEEVEKMNKRMEEVRDLKIQVVDENFLSAIQNGNPAATIEKIKSLAICDWGSDPLTRIPVEEVRQKESIYERRGEAGKSKVASIKLKNGTAIDPQSGLEDVAHVYSDRNGVLYTSTLSLTDIQRNKNSFYKMQVLKSDVGNKFWVFRSWGRIGTKVGNQIVEPQPSAESACDLFESLYEEKSGNSFNSGIPFKKIPGKYHQVDIDYDDGKKSETITKNSSIKSKLPKPTQDLVEMLFDVNAMKQTLMEFELDLDKMPLGRLSKKQLTEAYQVLTDLNNLVVRGAPSHEFIGLSNKFFTLVPHNFGMNKAPVIDTLEMIQSKREILDNLIEVEIAYSMLNEDVDNSLNPLDAHYDQLKTELLPLDHKTEEFELINQYVQNTHAATHSNFSLEIIDVFKVSRQGEKRRYKPFKKLHNRQLLWHGSRLTNYVGILSHGLKIAPPEAPSTGYMFGKGIYFADMVSKSANYCFTSHNNDVGLMLLSEVALGDMHELTQAKFIEKLPKGKHSTKGVGSTTPDPTQFHTRSDGVVIPYGKPVENKTIRSSLLYNEYIVYDVAQANVQYLLKLKFNYKR